MTRIIRIKGAGAQDMCYTQLLPQGEITWNVSRILAAARKGIFGPPQTWPMSSIGKPQYEKGNLERAVIDAVTADRARLEEPVLAIGAPPPPKRHILCFCDGNHRLTARYEMRLPDFRVYVVPHDVESAYRIIISNATGAKR